VVVGLVRRAFEQRAPRASGRETAPRTAPTAAETGLKRDRELVGFERAGLVGAPFAPRADIEISFDAEHGQRDEVVACSHT